MSQQELIFVDHDRVNFMTRSTPEAETGANEKRVPFNTSAVTDDALNYITKTHFNNKPAGVRVFVHTIGDTHAPLVPA